METLKERFYEIVCEYAASFRRITNIDGKINPDTLRYTTEDYGSFTVDEVRYIVDNATRLSDKYEDIGNEIADWFGYVADCVEFGIFSVSLQEWFNDKRQPTRDELEHLRAIKKRLYDEIEKMQSDYGKSSLCGC